MSSDGRSRHTCRLSRIRFLSPSVLSFLLIYYAFAFFRCTHAQYRKRDGMLITVKCPCSSPLIEMKAKHWTMILFSFWFDGYTEQDNASRDESSVIQSDLFCLNGDLQRIRERPRAKMAEKSNILTLWVTNGPWGWDGALEAKGKLTGLIVRAWL